MQRNNSQNEIHNNWTFNKSNRNQYMYKSENKNAFTSIVIINEEVNKPSCSTIWMHTKNKDIQNLHKEIREYMQNVCNQFIISESFASFHFRFYKKTKKALAFMSCIEQVNKISPMNSKIKAKFEKHANGHCKMLTPFFSEPSITTGKHTEQTNATQKLSYK